MKRLATFLFSVLICNIAFASDKNSVIANAALLDERFNVDKRIILAYIQTESSFNPYVISIKTNDSKFLEQVFKDINIKTAKHGKYVALYPKDIKEAEFVYDILQMNKQRLSVVDYDFGIMQLNTRTVKSYGANEKDLYLDWKQNMYYGTDVMRGCFNMLRHRTTMANVIECYNRGSSIKHLNASDRSYLSKFMKNYEEIKKEYD